MEDIKSPTTLLHVGFPRTATTTLQRELGVESGNALFIGRSETYSVENSRWLNQLFFEKFEPLMQTDGYSHAGNENFNQMLLNLLQTHRKSWIIASDERICKPPKERSEEWRIRQAEYLSHLFPNGYVLLTIRRQWDLMKSLFGRTIQSLDRPISFRTWLDEGGGSRYCSWRERFDFNAYYDAMVSAFGKDRVFLAAYEEYTKTPSLLTGIFKQTYPSATTEICFERTNNSGRFLKKQPTRNLLDLLSSRKLRYQKSSFEAAMKEADDEFRCVADAFQNSNEQLASRAGINLASLGYF